MSWPAWALVMLALALSVGTPVAQWYLNHEAQQQYDQCLDNIRSAGPEAASHAGMNSGPWLTRACSGLSSRDKGAIWTQASFEFMSSSPGA